jgi:anaerobic magnesium-protoporphyrin IX monomethyl ester cyclase
MKILFINPCLRRNHPLKLLPVGLASVMSYVQSQGFSFDLLDIDIHEYDDNYVENFIKDHSYDVILYGSIVTHYKWIKWLTRTIKKYHPETKVVIGNSVASSCYELFLKNAPADVVVIGEGEITCSEVLNAYSNNLPLDKVEGIAFRDDSGNIRKTPVRAACEIDDLPMVNWEFFEFEKYIGKGELGSCGVSGEGAEYITMPVSTARGCAFRCSFCHFVFWDDPYRYRSPENVMAEIRRNMDKYNANYIQFWDDLSFASIPQAEKMVDAILESGLKFKWSASIRTDLFGHPRNSFEKRLEVAKKMKQAGCVSANYSLESGNEEILEMMNKKVLTEYFEEQVKVLKLANITSSTAVVFGYPMETAQTIEETFEQCYKNEIYPSIGFLLPLPYTKMYDYALENGFIHDEDAFLDSITERQDICLNMTKMSDDGILQAIKEGGKKLNSLLNLGLDESTYIKTGGHKKHTKVKPETEEGELVSDKLIRNENDVSFNYSRIGFDEKQ